MNDEEAERSLGGGWAGTPAAFEPYKDPKRARKKPLDPAKWIDEWSRSKLAGADCQLIRAAILRADAEFWREPGTSPSAIRPMQLAYKEVAQVLFDSGVLTAEILTTHLPIFIWECAVAGGWWHLASEEPRDIFPDQIGCYYVWRDDSRDWNALFRSEISHWTASLLVSGSRPRLHAKRPASTKRNPKYVSIEAGLRDAAKSVPKGHEEVFCCLDGRVRIPNAEPFRGAGGWLKGFQRDPAAARSWLSKQWSRLELPPFQRGPK